jgi:hypothetical protein
VDRNRRCGECGREQAGDGPGWRAYLATDEDEPAGAVIYGPEGATREFGAWAEGVDIKNDSRMSDV